MQSLCCFSNSFASKQASSHQSIFSPLEVTRRKMTINRFLLITNYKGHSYKYKSVLSLVIIFRHARLQVDN